MKFEKLIFIFLLFVNCSFFYARSQKTSPMSLLTNVELPDGEYIVVGQYTGKEKIGEVHSVTTYVSSNIIKVYSFWWVFNNKDLPLPTHYTNYNYIFTIDLSTGQMLQMFYDNTDYYVKKNKNTGLFYEDCRLTNNRMIAYLKFWDGEEIREKKYEFKNVDFNYPFWHYMPFFLIGARIYDWKRGGYINVWQEYVKEPFLARYKIINENVILDTKIGKIKTTEVIAEIQDPVFAGLMKQFTEAMRFWYEDGPKRRWIKFELDIGKQYWIIEKYQIWK
ncbi:MAG: hypothetical protein WHS77_09565 [Brevinematales bacterium]